MVFDWNDQSLFLNSSIESISLESAGTIQNAENMESLLVITNNETAMHSQTVQHGKVCTTIINKRSDLKLRKCC